MAPQGQPGHGQQEYGNAGYGEPVYSKPTVYGQRGRGEGDGGHQRPKKSRKIAIAITAGALAVIAASAVVAVKALKHGPGTPVTGMIPTGATAQQDGQQIATAFLQAWRAGNLGTVSYTHLTLPT